VVRAGSTAILFDVSQDVVGQLKNVKRLDAAFISHPHSDAYGGLPHLAQAIAHMGIDHLPVYAEAATWKRNRDDHPTADVDEHVFRIGTEISIGPFTIRPFRVLHTPNPVTHPTAGFAVSVGDRRIVLISDVKRIPPRSYRTIGHPDLLIMDCALYDLEFPNHVNFAEALEIVRRIRPQRTLLTQIGVTWPPYHEARRIARRSGVDLSYDGLTVRL
jgi:phosphoribosyl 1,2-cyclic phosphodiesterase